MNHLYSILLLLLAVERSHGFVDPNFMKQVSSCSQYNCVSYSPSLASTTSPTASEFTSWRNENYPNEDILKYWKETDHLMTIGSTGVTDRHINSLVDLTKAHNVVKVKIASDRLISRDISEFFMQDDRLQAQVDLLEVRKRDFMVIRKEILPPKERKAPRRPLRAEYEANSANRPSPAKNSATSPRRSSSSSTSSPTTGGGRREGRGRVAESRPPLHMISTRGVGTIRRIGSAADAVAKGKRVFGSSRPGSSSSSRSAGSSGASGSSGSSLAASGGKFGNFRPTRPMFGNRPGEAATASNIGFTNSRPASGDDSGSSGSGKRVFNNATGKRRPPRPAGAAEERERRYEDDDE